MKRSFNKKQYFFTILDSEFLTDNTETYVIYKNI